MHHPIRGVTRPAVAARAQLEGLTSEQSRAVKHGTGPMLLLAGPGAGKTRTLTRRAAYLLATDRARPWEILAVTFSVRAAGELRLRLADLVGERVARAVVAATFHSVCARHRGNRYLGFGLGAGSRRVSRPVSSCRRRPPTVDVARRRSAAFDVREYAHGGEVLSLVRGPSRIVRPLLQ